MTWAAACVDIKKCVYHIGDKVWINDSKSKSERLTGAVVRSKNEASGVYVVECDDGSLSGNLISDELLDENCSGSKTHIKDHKFTIIKHANDHFQLVQGYIAQDNSSFAKYVKGVHPGVHSEGFGLASWQRYGNSVYNNRDGFSRFQMREFLSLLDNFVGNERFDGNAHETMFGVLPQHQYRYWPSFSFRELTDDFIIGCGERPMADSIELFVDSYTSTSY